LLVQWLIASSLVHAVHQLSSVVPVVH